MKTLGMIRRFDDLGRVTIPMELRKTLGLTEGRPEVEILISGNSIVLRKPTDEEKYSASELKEKILLDESLGKEERLSFINLLYKLYE